MKHILLIIFSLSFLGTFFLAPAPLHAHPGRTDSSGGHTCRTNCASWGLSSGEYHYHGGGAPVQSAPIQSAPVVQQNILQQPTVIPTRIPTRRPTVKPTPYVETALDKKKMFKVVS